MCPYIQSKMKTTVSLIRLVPRWSIWINIQSQCTISISRFTQPPARLKMPYILGSLPTSHCRYALRTPYITQGRLFNVDVSWKSYHLCHLEWRTGTIKLLVRKTMLLCFILISYIYVLGSFSIYNIIPSNVSWFLIKMFYYKIINKSKTM